MEKKNSKQLPDFDALNDRVIAEASPSPTLVIKTNLDAKSMVEENPYYDPKATKAEKEKLEQFFD
ncbi:hypothetical protein P9E76_15955 [Schinkia azotoformans]|uniref:Uncharacterized protein n=1 Tax=Schinkia azotoformans LMG 9581 TaxID=1131731 RepID=K6CU77_SCHAZ|nr:hypothetical protein [Schinkia azotoformans]EKN63797.1 hypothetical protein BAZO_16014 [Schinkia azotoformans LMG 9581]MEC1638032.1 hypothetical protein [Schinkia azotoformans]MEC1721586.1 hypothetical protein [Schinkia azotoformans]MEC1946534.1 hypothetical protein [Schinkia azotoformans]MED4352004.1 hypothetical protein [Schinkia azotoformans]